jgi:hypothetical protein
VAEKEEFYSFEKALLELRLRDDELKRLVSENVIRAFRDGDRMKLRREDVEKLKTDLGAGGGTEELVFEEEAGEEPGMATVPLAEAETMVEKTERKVVRSTTPTPRPAPARKPSPAMRPRPMPQRRKEVAAEATADTPAIKVVLALTSLVLVISLFIAFDVAKGQPGGVSRVFADMFAPKG